MKKISFRVKYTFILIMSLITIISLSEWFDENILQRSPFADSQVKQYSYKIINTFPHDSSAYTQGLVFYNGYLYEGTGLKGQSSIRKVELETGKIIKKQVLDSAYFGEGISIVNDELLQLSFISQTGFVYDVSSFKLKRQFTYPTQGWGLTYDGQRLIVTDGSANIYFYQPDTFEPLEYITVYDNKAKITKLNELEYIDGHIYANILNSDNIVKIDPLNGQVIASIDLSGLLSPKERKQGMVLNGIAYDVINKRIFVTGKNWPKLFEIELIPIISI